MIKQSRGFTLLEVAIVLVIVGLLLAGGVNLLSGSADTSKYKQTQNELQDVKEALLGYYISNKRLPCPDTDNDLTNAASYGVENPVGGGTCTSSTGWLPHVTLGVGGNGDAWGERFKYVVSPAFTTLASSTFCSTYSRVIANQVTIQDLQVPPATPAILGDWAAFALISTGKNGRQTNAGMTGAFTNDGGCTGLNVREQENCDTDSMLRFGTQMSGGSEIIFDDMVVWVGDYQLISQLRKTGGCN